MHHIKRLNKGDNRCTVWIHPEDAKQSGIKENQIINIQSYRGEIELPVFITEKIAKGIISIPHGYGTKNNTIFPGN